MAKQITVHLEKTSGFWVWKKTHKSASTFKVPEGIDPVELVNVLMSITGINVSAVAFYDDPLPVDPDTRHC